MTEKLQKLAQTNFYASLIAFGATAFSSMSNTITAVDQNIGLGFGAVTATAAIVANQIVTLQKIEEA